MLLPRNTQLVLSFLAENGHRLYSINQIARRLGISVSRTYDILKELESKGVVKPQRLGNAVFYSLDKTNEEARLLLRLVRIESGGRRGLKK